MLAREKYSKLWKETCAGNQKSYSELHSYLFTGLFEYARKMVKDEDVAHDIVQELFVKLWLKRERIGEIVNVKAYVFTSVRCMSINYLKSCKVRESNILNLDFPEFQFSAEELITNREASSILESKMRVAIDKLPGRQREMIYLRYFEELDYKQIVEVTGLKYQSVVNHIYRAVQLLRDEFSTTPDRCAA
ncbi:RNA polymerase sigma factor [Desertivirga arenae]|uniref:RNA polymerase sigma factor n=1 Tax=Desertivirga arenae TaxID=2810309 RepID=UPI001A979BD6|nr:sigma-70 family RNA polymerase sigma factor [Pedobacter sp. SYSU D00823]